MGDERGPVFDEGAHGATAPFARFFVLLQTIVGHGELVFELEHEVGVSDVQDDVRDDRGGGAAGRVRDCSTARSNRAHWSFRSVMAPW